MAEGLRERVLARKFAQELTQGEIDEVTGGTQERGPVITDSLSPDGHSDTDLDG